MDLTHRMSRVIVAMTLLAGPLSPVYAAGALTSSNKGTPIPAAQGAQARARAGFLNLPLYFEKNHGQTAAEVKYFARAAGYKLYLTASEAVMVLPRAKASKTNGSVVVRMVLNGSDKNAKVQGQQRLPGTTSYFLGKDRSRWQTGVEQFAKVKFSQVYPGIDMVYYGKDGLIEHDFIVAPGANPGRILVAFKGGKGLRLDEKGNLLVAVEGGQLAYKAPYLYQLTGEKRSPVQGRFVLAGHDQVRFEVGDYIRTKPLVIDPQLEYSTYLGGVADDQINAIVVDPLNQAYVTGWSRSDANNAAIGFPPATALFTTPPNGVLNDGGEDVFVAKLSADGSTMLWLAWIGGTINERPNALALDTAVPPRVFITGVTASNDFPVAAQTQTCGTLVAPTNGTLAFVSQLTQAGGIPALPFSTCLGGVSGTLGNTGNGIAVDAAGAAYVTGTTFAANFPTSLGIPAPFNTMGSTSQGAFVVKYAPLGAAITYSMYLGPSDTITNGNAIVVDTALNAWVVGMTASSTLPAVIGHFSSSKVGTSNAFVAEVAPDGKSLLYATYINGNSDQTATAVRLNNGGVTPYHVFVAGWTVSPTGFPSTAYYNLPTSIRPTVYQKDLTGADDPFILRINPLEPNPVPGADNPLEMQYATHLGATGADRAFALALDDANDAYIAGWTVSSDWTLAADPVTARAGSTDVAGKTTSNTAGGQTAFVAAIGPTGQFQPFFTYLGASIPGHAATGIVIDAARNIYVAGYARDADFPLQAGSLDLAVNRGAGAGAFDGFITKIRPVVSFGAPPPPSCTITSISPDNGFTTGGNVVTITGTSFFGVLGPGGVKFDGVAASTYTVSNSSTVIAATVPRHPLAGPFVPGVVPVTVTGSAGSCSTAYTYVITPGGGASCGDDYFFPSPATGAVGQFAYCMTLAGTVKIRIYNTVGDLVAKLENTTGAGAQLTPLNTARLAPGVYLYKSDKDYGGGNVQHSAIKKFSVVR